jgi:hypothetical protein
MASINDVFNELQAVNAALGQIHADGVAEISATDQVKDSVDTLAADVNVGFAATVNALNTIAQINIEAVKLLYHQTQQSDAMICALENISKNTCAILTQVTIQTQLQTSLRDDVDALRYIAESAHPEAALERQRHAELRAEIERCCPPDPPGPACTYEPCEQPEPVEKPRLPEINDGDHNPDPVG